MERTFWKAVGPGLIWAGAAVGVSHLVQSTRAGAGYGFQLIWVVILANLLKYPFFEFGPRYTASTGESLVHGYNRIGRWALYLFLFITLATMFTIQAAVTSVTVGIIGNIFPDVFSPLMWTIVLLSICIAIIYIGRYKTLDRIMKFVIVALTLSTIISVIAAFTKGFHPNPEFTRTFTWQVSDIAFLIALAGWMPSAIDISVWHSMWTMARIKQTNYRPKLKEALWDFNIGYIGTAILSLGFLSLGAFVMYGSGSAFEQSGVAFAGQLINLYTASIGQWSYYFIAVAALATMFSTTLTVLDAYPRVMQPTTALLLPKLNKENLVRPITGIWLLIIVAGTLIIIFLFTGKMRVLVDIATTLSFITAPVLGFLNFKIVRSRQMPKASRPGRLLSFSAYAGLIVLSVFAVGYLIWRFIA